MRKNHNATLLIAFISPLYLYLAHIPSQHLSLSTARPKAKPQHPLHYYLQAVFCNKKCFTTPIRGWNPAAPLATSPAEIKLYPSPNTPTSSIALPKNSYFMKPPSFYFHVANFLGDCVNGDVEVIISGEDFEVLV